MPNTMATAALSSSVPRIGERHHRAADAGAERRPEREHQRERRRAEALLARRRRLEHEEGQHRVGEAHAEPGDRPADRSDEDRNAREQHGRGDRDPDGDERRTDRRRGPAASPWRRRAPEARIRSPSYRRGREGEATGRDAAPRTSTTVSGTNASVPKNAKPIAKIAATPRAGRGRRRQRPRRNEMTQGADRQPCTDQQEAPAEQESTRIVVRRQTCVEPTARRNESIARRPSMRPARWSVPAQPDQSATARPPSAAPAAPRPGRPTASRPCRRRGRPVRGRRGRG